MNILIIGIGRIGAGLAYELSKSSDANVFLYGRDFSKTNGIATDLAEINPFARIVAIETLQAIPKVDLTIFAFSQLVWRPDINVNDRILEAKSNIKIIDDIASKIDLNLLGTVIILSNPVDCLTRYFYEVHKAENVFGFGNGLDELRVRKTLMDSNYKCKTFEAICIGEHGASVVPVLSQIMKQDRIDYEVYESIKAGIFKRAQAVIKHVSIPYHAPLFALSSMLNSMLKMETKQVRLSRYLSSAYLGVNGLSIGVPIDMKAGELKSLSDIELSDYERALFNQSAELLDKQYRNLFD